MDASTRVDAAILGYLRHDRRAHRRRATKKEIHKHVKPLTEFADANGGGDTTARSKKGVKRALKRLVERGCIAKSHKTYTLVMDPTAGDVDGDSDSAGPDIGATREVPHDSPGHGVGQDVLSGGNDGVFRGASPVMTIAERMRQAKRRDPLDSDDSEAGRGRRAGGKSRKVDLDDEIARLEAELAADDGESGSEGSDSEEECEPLIAEPSQKRAMSVVSDSNGDGAAASGIINLSVVAAADDRIAPLPASALPQNKRRKLKIDRTAEEEAARRPSDAKRKKRRQSSPDKDTEQCHEVSAGLKSAVADLLRNYVPSSQLALPFYCRVCQHQSSTQEEFDVHRASDFHRGAVREEQKRTFCKVCRKQLTSVVQMEEHLRSKPHRERMDFVVGKQRGGRSTRGGGGRGRGRGRGGRERDQPGGGGGRGGAPQRQDARGRQWC